MHLLQIALRQFAKILITVLVCGFAGGALARYSEGFGLDAEELDARLSSSARQHLREVRSEGTDFINYYPAYLARLARGDMGYSFTLNRPISELLSDRLPLTLFEIVDGVVVSGILAVGAALLSYRSQSRTVALTLDSFCTLALCLPVAIMGYICVWLRINPACALGLCTFPYLFRYTANGLETSRLSGHVIAARSRGVSALRILSIHILLPCVPGILAVAGVAVAIAFGAAIPVEFATETPGLGQLAWQAATSRDLPLICVLTMIVTTFVLGANGIVQFLEACFSFDRGLER